jgi:hypothetical protein
LAFAGLLTPPYDVVQEKDESYHKTQNKIANHSEPWPAVEKENAQNEDSEGHVYDVAELSEFFINKTAEDDDMLEIA